MYDPKRLPAWCDRVLWKSVFSSKKAEILDYYSAPEIASSDHKPVAALFRVPTGTSQLRNLDRRFSASAVFYEYGDDEENNGVIVLAIKKLRAERLFMIKRPAEDHPTLPNPKAQDQPLLISLPLIPVLQVRMILRGDRVYRTSTVYRRSDPVWKNAIRIKVNASQLQQLNQYRHIFEHLAHTH